MAPPVAEKFSLEAGRQEVMRSNPNPIASIVPIIAFLILGSESLQHMPGGQTYVTLSAFSFQAVSLRLDI